MNTVRDWARRSLLLSTLALATGACVGAEEPTVDTTAPTLRDVEIPADFDFTTTKSLHVVVTTEQAGKLEVLDQDGRSRFVGPALTERPTFLGLSVPLANDRVLLRLTEPGGNVRTEVVDIQDGRAEYAFR